MTDLTQEQLDDLWRDLLDEIEELKQDLNNRIDRTKPSAIPHHSWVGQGRQEKA